MNSKENDVKISGDIRIGAEFEITARPTNCASSTFAALTTEGLTVTRRLAELFTFPDDTPVLAHWHGSYRTDGFSTTVGELKEKASSAGYSVQV